MQRGEKIKYTAIKKGGNLLKASKMTAEMKTGPQHGGSWNLVHDSISGLSIIIGCVVSCQLRQMTDVGTKVHSFTNHLAIWEITQNKKTNRTGKM